MSDYYFSKLSIYNCDISAIGEHLSVCLAKYVPHVPINCYLRAYGHNSDTAFVFRDHERERALVWRSEEVFRCFLLNLRAGLRHWGPHAKGSWGPSPSLLSPSLSGPSISASLPLPPVPSSALSLPSSQLEVAT